MSAENQQFRLNELQHQSQQAKKKGHEEKGDRFEKTLNDLINDEIDGYETLEELIDEVDKADQLESLPSSPVYNPLESSMLHQAHKTQTQEKQDLLSNGKHGEVKKRGLD